VGLTSLTQRLKADGFSGSRRFRVERVMGITRAWLLNPDGNRIENNRVILFAEAMTRGK